MDITPSIIETEISPIAINTEIIPQQINAEITSQIIEISIAPSQNVTYNLEALGGYQSLPTAGQNIARYTVLAHSPHGLVIASAINLETWNIAGIALENTSNGGSILIQYNGVLTDSLWNWDISKPIFLGINGELTQHLPEQSLFLSQVATPVTTNSIFIDIKEVIYL